MSIESQVTRLRWQVRGLWIVIGLLFAWQFALVQVQSYNDHIRVEQAGKIQAMRKAFPIDSTPATFAPAFDVP